MSTPDSSGNNSPDLKPKTLNVSSMSSDLSPIQSCDEDLSSSNTLDSEWEKIPKMTTSSAPIQIPKPSNLLSTNELEKSYSAHSSRSGTPTFEVVSPMVPAGMPLVKMDTKISSKKGSIKTKPILKHFETAPIDGCCVSRPYIKY